MKIYTVGFFIHNNKCIEYALSGAMLFLLIFANQFVPYNFNADAMPKINNEISAFASH